MSLKIIKSYFIFFTMLVSQYYFKTFIYRILTRSDKFSGLLSIKQYLDLTVFKRYNPQ